MRAERLMSALMLLQAKGRVSGRELAEKLEVSQRTIHRDMEALSGARIPVRAMRGAQGGWQLEKGWRTQVPGLNEVELRALLMAQPRVIGHPRLAAAAESALNKLMAGLPGPLRVQAAAIRERLHVDPTGWRGAGEDLSMLTTVQDAVAAQRKLAFDYTKGDGTKAPRTVDPLGIVAKGMSWYMVARGMNGTRTYRVSRMEAVTQLASGFERPPKFDLAIYWKESTTRLEAERGRFVVSLLMAPDAARQLTVWGSGFVVERAGKSSERTGKLKGWIKVKVGFEDEDIARFVILGIGASVRVLGPEPFGKLIQAEARKIADGYGNDSDASRPPSLRRARSGGCDGVYLRVRIGP